MSLHNSVKDKRHFQSTGYLQEYNYTLLQRQKECERGLPHSLHPMEEHAPLLTASAKLKSKFDSIDNSCSPLVMEFYQQQKYEKQKDSSCASNSSPCLGKDRIQCNATFISTLNSASNLISFDSNTTLSQHQHYDGVPEISAHSASISIDKNGVSLENEIKHLGLRKIELDDQYHFENGNDEKLLATSARVMFDNSPSGMISSASTLPFLAENNVQDLLKRYSCTLCGKKFVRPSSLTTHTYSHTGEKPFQCPVEYCGRRFSVISNLRRHGKVHSSTRKRRPDLK